MEVVIRPMIDGDHSEVLQFIRKRYQKEFGTLPKEIPDNCVIARNEHRVIGALCMEFCHSGSRFHIEKYFLLDGQEFPCERAKTVYLGRWVADFDIGSHLLLAAISLSKKLGMVHTLACSKLNVLNYLRRRYKLRFTVHYSLGLNQSEVEPEHFNYFCKKPFPVLYTGIVQEWYDTLEKRLPSSIRIEL